MGLKASLRYGYLVWGTLLRICWKGLGKERVTLSNCLEGCWCLLRVIVVTMSTSQSNVTKENGEWVIDGSVLLFPTLPSLSPIYRIYQPPTT